MKYELRRYNRTRTSPGNVTNYVGIFAVTADRVPWWKFWRWFR